jgi:hypothetical protein
MKSQILRCFAGLSLVLGSLLTSAQSNSQLTINVPFDFMVGRTMFPAGEYNVGVVKRQTYVLAAKNGYEYVVMKTPPAVIKAGFRSGGLVFMNDGHHYRLQQVSMPGAGRAGLSQSVLAGRPIWVAASNAAANHPRILRTGREY